MNYPYLIPSAQSDTAAFVANSTLQLGTYVKPLGARTQISVDYSSAVPPVLINNFSFRVRPGGEPQLWISDSDLGAGADFITFFIEGGIGGRAYEVVIHTMLASGEVRSDVLNVQVLGGDNCCPAFVLPALPNQDQTSGDGSIIVNTAPRFFISGSIPVGANVLDRWYDTTTGELYDYISNGITSLWQLAGSGGGGGGGSGSGVIILTIAPIQPDGSTTVFTLTSLLGRPVTITTSNTLFVSVDGVWQQPDVQYAAVNNQVSFVQPPSNDSQVFMLWFAPYAPTYTP